jgi:hypothetical protein
MSFQQTVSLGKVEAFPENELDIHKEGHIESFVADFETAYVSSDQEINTAISPNTVQMLQSGKRAFDHYPLFIFSTFCFG